MQRIFNIFTDTTGSSGRKETVMSEEFKAITTQEEFDAAIGERIKRERKVTEEKYKGWMSPEDAAKKYEGFLSPEDAARKYEGYISPEEAAKKDAQIRSYEADSVKTRIAHETGIGYDAIKFLQGDDEKSIKESAESLKKLMGTGAGAPPMFSQEPSGDGKKDKEREALKKVLADMKGE